ncbi:hypothetical protein HaLaN_21184, partial [Haematococcus lacustris]
MLEQQDNQSSNVQLVGLASMRSVPVEAMHVMYLK